MNAAGSAPVAVLLWDCDGVLQHGDGTDWTTRLDALGGPGFAQAVFEAEVPALRGERSFAAVLGELLRRWPVPGLTVADLLSCWERFTVDDGAVQVMREVAAQGIRCVLATNQQDHRRSYMAQHTLYEQICDGAFYSCEVGAMKPEPAFFERILDALDVPAERVGFVDDVPANVEAARRLGIRAVLHDPATGADGLRRDLAPLLAP